MSDKKIFVTSFPFPTDSLKPPPLIPLTAKTSYAWQKFFVDAPLSRNRYFMCQILMSES